MDINSISNIMIKIYDSTINLLFNIYFIVIVIILMGVFYMLNSFSLGSLGENNNSSSSDIGSIDDESSFNFGIPSFFIHIFIAFAIMYGIIKVVNAMYNIDIVEIIKNIFSNQRVSNIIQDVQHAEHKLTNPGTLFDDADSDIGEEDSNKDKDKKKQSPEVFNVSNNKYNYTDAKAVCKAYKTRLATYTEVEDSYNAGGEWCNYGWSEDQMALFPTQTKTYNVLQKISGHEHDCGRPGVNGGYINNSELKYGVNCYGIKPDKTLLAEKLMENKELYPKSKQDIELEKRVEFWKTKLDDLLVSPFNHTKWYRV